MSQFENQLVSDTQLHATIHARKQEVKKFSMQLHAGLKLFCYNPTAGTLEEVSFEQATIALTEPNLNGDGNDRLKITFIPGCHYVQAINYKNAMRKLNLKKHTATDDSDQKRQSRHSV